MVKHLGLDAKGVLDESTGRFDEKGNTIESVEQQRVFDNVPKGSLKPGAVVAF